MNAPQEGPPDRPVEKGQAGTMRIYVALTAPAILSIVVFAAAEGSWSIFALSTLIGACAFSLGALLGFLFGIPQYFAGAEPRGGNRATYQPNTNLTQVSDWLTKIIIGVGLVQFGQLVDTLGQLGDSLEPSLGGEDAGKAFGIALVVGFFVIGFLVGYLYTRLRLQWAFASADRGAFEQVVKEAADRQKEADMQALKLFDRKAEELPEEQLNAVVSEASPAAVEQVRAQAKELKATPQAAPNSPDKVLEAIDKLKREQS